MVQITSQIKHDSGIPLGGIGTGSVEIRPDGLFHEWHMFNVGQWNPKSPCAKGVEAMGPHDLVFMVRTEEADGKVIVRYLALRPELHDLYCLPWARSVAAIHFDGRFPVAMLTYDDPELPVSIQAEVFSPFVALDSRASGTPGFYVHFTVRNETDSWVDVSILGVIKNAAGYDQESREPRHTLHDIVGGESAVGGQGKAIRLSADSLEPGVCSTGDMTFAAVGGEISYVTGALNEDHRSMTFHHSRYGLKMTSFMHAFRDNGRLPNLNAQTPPEFIENFDAAKLSDAERAALLDRLLQYPAFYDKCQRLQRVDPDLVMSPDFLDELMANVKEINDRKIEFNRAALCSRMELDPEAEGEALFTVGWFFPNHISPTGENIGHQYEHWFGNSLDVVDFLVANFPALRIKTISLPDAIHSSSMPTEAADAVTSQLSTLTKCTWWTKAGHFGVWEGYGCCGFHTTDITYQGSFPIISLFPDLQKAQMTRGAEFQRDDGRVHHFFTPDFSAVDNGFDRVDMNQQFVMLAARDYLWTGDRAYLDTLWPHIIRAMDNTAELDTDGDGLPDTDTRRNTYDAWDFQGCPSYISSLWLGALKAAVRLANEIGDRDRAAKWQSTYERGVASFEEKLWNGEYYVLWRDGDTFDECCMSDQMSGDWFAGACGWGPILKPERIVKALDAVVLYNFQPSQGLINASYPPDKPHRLAASGNYQADAPWTGIEYTVAALLIEYGMVSEGLAIVRDIHQRYLQAGRFWSHVECGSHYYRAMSSWTVMLALSGFRWDQPTQALTFAPAIDEPVSEYPFFTSTAWGTFYQQNSLTGRVVEIELSDGEISVSKLFLPKLTGFDNATAAMGEKELDISVGSCGDGVCITFAAPLKLTAESGLVVVA
jgi:uncharacterized protein (DUF608 family)